VSQRRALILGISGQDGAYLSRLLVDKGYEVHGTSRDHQRHAFANLKAVGTLNEVVLHTVQPTEISSVQECLLGVVPHEVYNLSAQSSVGLSFKLPLETFESIAVASLNLLESLRRIDWPVRLLNAATSESFGNTNQPADEQMPFRPVSPYAAAKATTVWNVANYRNAYGIYACSSILFNHESPLRPSRYVTMKIVETAIRIADGSEERLSLGNLDIERDWGWAQEYVEAMWRMLQQDIPDDFVIATGRSHKLRNFVAMVFEQLGRDWRDHVDIDTALMRPLDIAQSTANPGKAKRELGWEARVALPEIITRLIAAEKTKQAA
jgi:GDPmannose 4,6-dehydratase